MTSKHLFIFLLFCSLIGSAQVMWQFKKDTVITWNYFDGDEFNGDKINTEVWNYTSGGSHTIFNNLEQQYYTNGNNHSIKNGAIQLIARKEKITGRVIDWKSDSDSLSINKKFFTLNKKTFEYSSGMLETKKLYKYGFFECRLKIPKEKGYWPAFWLHGGNPNEEIDMMECKSERPHQVHIDTHCPNRCDEINYFFQKRSYGGWAKTKIDFTNEFAIFACDWDENGVKFYLNGENIGVSNVKFGVEKLLTLNLAIPDDNGPFHPGPDKNNNTEAVFEIDYVRVWSKHSENIGKINPNKTIDANITSETSKKLLEKSLSKTKNKLVYGSKSEHKDDGIFISCFNNKDFIQLITLGVFKGEKPKYIITSSDGKEIASGIIENQVFNISKTTFQKGGFMLSIHFNNKLAQKSFIVD